MELDNVTKLILEYDSRLLKRYKKSVASNFKCNSNTAQILSERQYYILYIIKYKNIDTITGIAKYLSLSKANLSILTSKMEVSGLVVRNKLSQKDSRVANIVITEKGNMVFDNFRENAFKDIKELIDGEVFKEFDIYSLITELKKFLDIDKEIVHKEDIFLMIFIKLNYFLNNVHLRFVKENDINISVAELKIIKTIALFENINFEIITEALALSYSTVSLQVKSLESKGIVNKVKCKDDGRITYIDLTQKGQDIINMFYSCKKALIKEMFLNKSEEEIIRISKVFCDLIKLFDYIENIYNVRKS